jgi:hypothetical protein
MFLRKDTALRIFMQELFFPMALHETSMTDMIEPMNHESMEAQCALL